MLKETSGRVAWNGPERVRRGTYTDKNEFRMCTLEKPPEATSEGKNGCIAQKPPWVWVINSGERQVPIFGIERCKDKPVLKFALSCAVFFSVCVIFYKNSCGIRICLPHFENIELKRQKQKIVANPCFHSFSNYTYCLLSRL
ncbi:MAG: hypothetical protein LCH81_14400 [Bacteroidetes bacterium]|nr:hypothetical protein [Bacteroidota bacterium]